MQRFSDVWERMEEEIVHAAESADVKARWTPEEKKGSMKATSKERHH